jgi:hypothetical protein
MTVDMMWLILAVILVTGVLTISSAFVTGFLVMRARRDSHETLFGPAKRKPSGKPINIDEFAAQADPEEEGLPDSIALQNKIFGSIFATDGLKERK